jgi:hypothetical protein
MRINTTSPRSTETSRFAASPQMRSALSHCNGQLQLLGERVLSTRRRAALNAAGACCFSGRKKGSFCVRAGRKTDLFCRTKESSNYTSMGWPRDSDTELPATESFLYGS